MQIDKKKYYLIIIDQSGNRKKISLQEAERLFKIQWLEWDESYLKILNHIEVRYMGKKLGWGLFCKERINKDTIINIWSPDPDITNYKFIHGFTATTSMVLLHDIIHLNILSSYPKHLALLVHENVKRMRSLYPASATWEASSLSWKLIDFSASPEGNKISDDLNELFSTYIKYSCKTWFEKIDRHTVKVDKEKTFLMLFHELLSLIKNDNLWILDGTQILRNLGFENMVSR